MIYLERKKLEMDHLFAFFSVLLLCAVQEPKSRKQCFCVDLGKVCVCAKCPQYRWFPVDSKFKD